LLTDFNALLSLTVLRPSGELSIEREGSVGEDGRLKAAAVIAAMPEISELVDI
jgi:hypothetical protein